MCEETELENQEDEQKEDIPETPSQQGGTVTIHIEERYYVTLS